MHLRPRGPKGFLRSSLPEIDRIEMRSLIHAYGGLTVCARRYGWDITTINNWCNGRNLHTVAAHQLYQTLLSGRTIKYAEYLDEPLTLQEYVALVRYHSGYVRATQTLHRAGLRVGIRAIEYVCLGKRSIRSKTAMRTAAMMRFIRDHELGQLPAPIRPHATDNTYITLRPLIDWLDNPSQAARFISCLGVEISPGTLSAWYRRCTSTHFRPDRLLFVSVMAALRFCKDRMPRVVGRVRTSKISFRHLDESKRTPVPFEPNPP